MIRNWPYQDTETGVLTKIPDNVNYFNKIKLSSLDPKEYYKLVRYGKWRGSSLNACKGFAQGTLIVIQKEYANEFILFCIRNPKPFPLVEITKVGEPIFQENAPDADIRTDLPKYYIFRDGKIIDECINIEKYWNKESIGILIGCSRTFIWEFEDKKISWKRYGIYRSNIDCKQVGSISGKMAVSILGFTNSSDLIKAFKISMKYPKMHGEPIHIGNPEIIGVSNVGKKDDKVPGHREQPVPEKDEILLFWACGATAQLVAIKSKIPLITHTRTFVLQKNMIEMENF